MKFDTFIFSKLIPSCESHFYILKSQKGISLVEVLVAAGIMAIVGAATMSMIADQGRETKAVSEKMAALDVERLLINSLGSGVICSSELSGTVFNPSGPYKLDSTNLPTQNINLSSLHASSIAGAPALITAGAQASALSKNLKIDTINFKDFISAGLPDIFLTNLEVKVKDGVRSLNPIVIKMIIETNPTDPPNAKSIVNCSESGRSDKSYRFKFFSSTTWTVPTGVRSAFVTMAGGGGSGLGWRLVNSISTGHSGGYVFSEPVNLIPGEALTITIGTGGRGYGAVSTGVPAQPGPPYYIYAPPAGDDGLGGYPGGSSKIVSPSMGTLMECSGGSGATIGGVDAYDSMYAVAGDLAGAITGGGSPSYPAPNRTATGTYVTPGGPGACGTTFYGIGNVGPYVYGTSSAGPPSGNFIGGTTPFGYGSGGDVGRSGCYVTSTKVGTCTYPTNGRDGVVYIDVRY